MRKSVLKIALSCLLGFTLVFNQLALNFFHNRHDAHDTHQIQNDSAQFHPHGEHCKVCSLDTLFHLYFEPSPEFHFHLRQEPVLSIAVLAKVIASGDFSKGRAPPYFV